MPKVLDKVTQLPQHANFEGTRRDSGFRIEPSHVADQNVSSHAHDLVQSNNYYSRLTAQVQSEIPT